MRQLKLGLRGNAMTIFARAVAGLTGAAVLGLLAGCNDEIVVTEPADGATVGQSTVITFRVGARSTRSGPTLPKHWELGTVRVDGQDFTSLFPTSGQPGQLVSADVTLPRPPGDTPVTRNLEVRATMKQRFVPDQDLTKFVSFLGDANRVTLTVPNGTPRESPALFMSPVPVSVAANFRWHGASVTYRGNGAANTGSAVLSTSAGPAASSTSGALPLPIGGYQLVATVLDASNVAKTDAAVLRVASGIAPNCNVTPGCSVPNGAAEIALLTNVPEGTLVAEHCGGGRWTYTDSTHVKCRAEGGNYSSYDPTPPNNLTVCPRGINRKFVSNVATCVVAGEFSTPPP